MNLKRVSDREIRKRKRDYEVKTSNEAKKIPNNFFSYIRSKKIVRDNIGPLLDSDGNLINENKAMATVLIKPSVKSLRKKIIEFPNLLKYFKVQMKICST